MKKRIISFSPPDITEKEIDEVVKTLKSDWITTGPKTKLFEEEISKYCGTDKAICLNSATAGLELILRLFEIGPGDEVITTPYTFASTANVIIHVGAKPVFVDTKENEFNIDPKQIGDAITKKTKAVIPVDFAGWPCDYDELYNVLKNKSHLYNPKKKSFQEKLDRPLLFADSAHAFGAEYNNKKIGNIADLTVFSMHAVKNLTTAEGGAITFNSIKDINHETIYKKLKLFSLHGQSKDAFTKLQAGSWKYTIECPGYKYNMTDIMASIGLVQLERYDKELMKKRKLLFELYNSNLVNSNFILPPFDDKNKKSSYHLYPLRINGIDEEKRDKIIYRLANIEISVNVHFIPLVLHPYYKKIGYSISDYPNTYDVYKNEITLPLHTKMSEDDVIYICENLKKIVKDIL